MFNPASRMEALPFSEIRVMMERATKMQKNGEDVIHMEIGRPDFDTPQVIKDAANRALANGNVFYTSNYGTPELRQAIADVKALGKTSAEMADYLLDHAKIAAVPGSAFGPQGEGYIRLSYACSYERIVEAMERLKKAVADLKG